MKALKLLALLVLGALLFLGGRATMESDTLRLERFEVVGNTEERVATESVIEAAGVEPGDQLVGISTAEISRRLEELPWVARARVERILPSTLRIAIDEREAWVVVEGPQGSFLVDEQGLVLQQGSQRLVVLTDLPLSHIAPGMRITAEEFSHVSRILRSLPPEIGNRVVSVRARSIDQIQIETGEGPLIHYGAAEQIDEKNFAVQTLMSSTSDPAAAAGVIDVRVPSRPATRPR